ncbi:hypothetical protein C9374_011612 [Naegleria lovaniensis]|uniref:Uncharacterized protein n=1 Tax=Naegleria lovaniensis TaxID=51637 RepID=A0AA88GE61_NAELO|nr:uncharacterized protein C9374_011612 [Naegleria lovaniensis]KAG2373947.1 hypothetical protein C9374_011612 [Naegleria lovaniensis]
MPAKSSHKQKRKVWSVKEKREVLAYAKLHGNTAAINKYECTESSFYEAQREVYSTRESHSALFEHCSNRGTTVCHGRGNCTSPDRCECMDHYAGPDCQYPKCFGLSSNDSNVCSQHGACVDVNTCHCHENYGGSNCSIPKCFGILSTNSTHVCHGRGICQSVNLCQCTNSSEYGGNSCEWTRCFEILENNAQVCSGHGTCVAPNSCQCQQGYSGTQCQTLNNYACFSKLTTDPMVCSGHGTCIAPNQCQCENNYFGETCSVTACHGIMSNESTVCNSAGICTSPNVCQCQAGYTGSTCEHVMCFGMESNRTSFVCSGHGDCVSPNHCQCHSQWTGVNCGVPLCNGMSPSNPNVCSGRGSCTSPNVCQCQAGYTGSTCEIVYCHDKLSNDPNVCSSHGTCVSPNSCQCMYGYSGSNCQVPVCFGKNANEVRNVCSDCSVLASLVLNTFQPSYIHVNQYHGDVYRSHTDQHSITKQVSTTIQVIAGNGVAGFSGDGALARTAQLNHPKGIFVTFSGEIYIADCYNHRIRKIDSQGIISTVVGRGNTPGMSGDFGSALNAQLSFPENVYLSNSLELYIVDTGNHRIRKVNRNGIIQTIAGNSSSGFNGDSLLAIDAQLNTPKSVAVDSLGQVFIADCNNHRIRKINVAGMISTVVGDGIGGEYLMYPTSVFVTNQNELLVTDSGHNRTVFINSNGTLSTIASSTNSTPLSVFASNNGEIFIAESTSTWVQKIYSQELTISKGIISTIAGTDEKGYSGDGDLATRSSLWMPMSVFVNHLGENFNTRRTEGSLGISWRWIYGFFIRTIQFAHENFCGSLHKHEPTNARTHFHGGLDESSNSSHPFRRNHFNGQIGYNGEDILAIHAHLQYPHSVHVSQFGEIYIADTYNFRIRKVNTEGIISTIAGVGEMGFSGDGGQAIHAKISNCESLFVTNEGEVFFTDTFNNRIRKIDVNGIISTIAGVGESGFSGDGGQAIDAKFQYPHSVFVSNMGEVFVADSCNHRIRKFQL